MIALDNPPRIFDGRARQAAPYKPRQVENQLAHRFLPRHIESAKRTVQHDVALVLGRPQKLTATDHEGTSSAFVAHMLFHEASSETKHFRSSTSGLPHHREEMSAPPETISPGRLTMIRQDRKSLLQAAKEVFGERLAEIILTRDPEHFHGLESVATQLRDSALTPLSDAVLVANALRHVAAPDTIQAWFVGMNPLLGDEEPALVISRDPKAVWAAAEHFLAYG
jgi:hypothetical protein